MLPKLRRGAAFEIERKGKKIEVRIERTKKYHVSSRLPLAAPSGALPEHHPVLVVGCFGALAFHELVRLTAFRNIGLGLIDEKQGLATHSHQKLEGKREAQAEFSITDNNKQERELKL